MRNRNIPCTKKGTELTETKNTSRLSTFAGTLSAAGAASAGGVAGNKASATGFLLSHNVGERERPMCTVAILVKVKHANLLTLLYVLG